MRIGSIYNAAKKLAFKLLASRYLAPKLETAGYQPSLIPPLAQSNANLKALLVPIVPMGMHTPIQKNKSMNSQAGAWELAEKRCKSLWIPCQARNDSCSQSF
jgi:hypothetical protein